ncbi:MAG: hypothetical protein PHE07_01495 [Bacteroidales bacterium]|nr:hypothetical protein [Bacteroidales bacterium]
MDILKKYSEELENIQQYLEITVSDDPNEISERLSMIAVYMARTGFILAEAKMELDQARVSVFSSHVGTIGKLPATVSKMFIESVTDQQNRLVNWIDRLNSSCIHQGDILRTLLSFQKENLKLTRTGY